jgi:mono/diheme cytochrome c family protein
MLRITLSSYTYRRWLAGLLFALSASIAVVGLAACDTGTASSVPTNPPGTVLPRTGEAIFARYCTVCHPGGGQGSGPSLITGRFSAMQIKERVRQGYGRMPPFGPDIISDDELNSLVSYLQGLRH